MGVTPEPMDMPFGLLSGVPDVITHAKFIVNRLRGFSLAAPPKVPFPILFWTTLTTVLHYRADRDWHPISYRFVVIAAYCSNFRHCVFEPPFRGLGTTYDVHLGLIRVNWTFLARCYGWVATSEKRSKIGDFAPTRSVWPKFQVEGVAPHQPCLHG